MPSFADAVLDAALDEIRTATRLDLCTAEPANYAGLAAVTLGNKTGVTIPAAADRSGGGREVTVPATTAGTITGSGEGDYYALSDPATSSLIATGALRKTLNVTGWSITSAVATLTFENVAAVTAALTKINARSPAFGSVVLASAIGSVPAGKYVITAVSVASRTVSFAVAVANGSGTVTATAQVTGVGQTLTSGSGNTFSTAAFTLGITDPV